MNRIHSRTLHHIYNMLQCLFSSLHPLIIVFNPSRPLQQPVCSNLKSGPPTSCGPAKVRFCFADWSCPDQQSQRRSSVVSPSFCVVWISFGRSLLYDLHTGHLRHSTKPDTERRMYRHKQTRHTTRRQRKQCRVRYTLLLLL